MISDQATLTYTVPMPSDAGQDSKLLFSISPTLLCHFPSTTTPTSAHSLPISA